MSLNNQPFNLILKQGTVANLALSTTYLQQGELAYTTDDKQLHISDGTNKLAIPVLSVGVVPLSGTVTIVTAQLTTLGSQGSMTFVNGVLTAQTPAT